MKMLKGLLLSSSCYIQASSIKNDNFNYQVLERTCGIPATKPNLNIFTNLDQRSFVLTSSGNSVRHNLSKSSKNSKYEIKADSAEKTSSNLNTEHQLASYYTNSQYYKLTKDSQKEFLQTTQTQRIVGGQEANPHSWPWQAHLSVCGKWYGMLECNICGGAIVHPDWVVTAAHCMPESASGTVILGAHSLSTGGTQRIPVVEFMQHPSWNSPANFDNDVALLRLSQSATFNDHVSPICLPSPSTCFEPKTPCIVTGWGLQNELGGFPDELQEVAVKIIEQKECKKYRGYENISDNMVCAGYANGGRDACAGDSGGPLVCKVPGSAAWVIYGVVSWGYGCARPGAPGVYARLPNLVGWIKEATGGKVGFDDSSVWSECASYDETIDNESWMQATTGERNVEFSKQKLNEFKELKETEISQQKQSENQKQPENTTNIPKTTKTTPVTQTQGCGGTYFEGSGSVGIPGFPGAYKKHQYCKWEFVAKEQDATIEIEIPRFKLYCRQGFMDEFRVKYADLNGKDQVQALCNVRRPLKIKSVKPVIIEFESGSKNTWRDAFEFEYKIVKNKNQVSNAVETGDVNAYTCGRQEFVVAPGPNNRVEIKSENFPKKYDANTKCGYHVKTHKPGQKIHLSVKRFKTEGKTNGACSRDSDNLVVVASENCDIENFSEKSIVVGPLCGKFKKQVWKTNESSICIYFKADSDNNRGKFLLEAFAVNP